MTERTRTGLFILQAAAVMGLLGNLLLRQTPWGLNAFLFVTAFALAVALIEKKRRPELLTVKRIGLLAAMAFLGSMFLIRDSIELRVYDTIGILVIMGVLLLGPLGIDARLAGVFHYGVAFFWSGLVSLFGPLLLLGADVNWKEMPGTPTSRRVFSVLRGAAIALPLLLIFGALFSSADARFEAFANKFVDFDLATVISHVVLTGLFAWLTAGYFRASVFTPKFASAPAESEVNVEPAVASTSEKPGGSSYFEQADSEFAGEVSLPDNATILEHINRSDPPNVAVPVGKPIAQKRDWQNIDSSAIPSVFTLGVTETIIILGLLDLLFVTFVVFQVPYLFGGMELVQNTPDFKLADYARRGFGELVAVSALVLPILLLSHWLLRRESHRLEPIFRVLAGVQITLVFVIMASAIQRLVLLTGSAGYGLTTVRFYPMVVMVWLAVVFGWFAFTVLRGARNNFAWGALWSAIIILGATNLMNPDAFIARINIDLMHQGRNFDAFYNDQLSTDAVPAVFSAMPSMSPDDQCSTKGYLQRRYLELEKGLDIRSFNTSRRTVFELLRQNEELLNTDGCSNVTPRQPMLVSD